MSFFVDHIQPLIGWLQENPSWSLFITFLISLAESLAVIGSIVPGSVTMTAIGILAGSGIMRIDLTLLASALGAVCGDSLSYALGYIYSEKIHDIWPFRKYPNLLLYGKEFFSRHGGKSVLIGRFVGPLRSIIPVIAGIVHMKQWRFLITNIISAVGWSLLYVMPGVLIGAAGHELSSENAKQLFILILVLLLGIWLTSLLIKWLLISLHSFFKNNLHDFWLAFKKRPLFSKLYQALTPPEELNHYHTAGIFFLALMSLLGSIVLLILHIETQNLIYVDEPTYLFFQSVHTDLFEAIFIICTQLTSTLTISCLYVSCCIWFVYQKKIRALTYLSYLVIASSLIAYALSMWVQCPRPQGLLVVMTGNSFPNSNLLVATALYGFIFYYINNRYSLLTHTLRSLILVILGFSGLGSIYLGDNWFTDIMGSYFIGSFISLIFCLFYRKGTHSRTKKHQSVVIHSLLLIIIVFSSLVSIYLNFRTLSYAHTPYHQVYSLDESTWWDQQKPILPLYYLNRIGKKSSLLNIQYSGDLTLLQGSLEAFGWESHNESFFTKLLMRVNGTMNGVKVPLFTPLYENKSPVLVMTFKNTKTNLALELVIWESNYNLYKINGPLWIGTVYPSNYKTSKIADNAEVTNSLTYIAPALKEFILRRVTLQNRVVQSTIFPNAPYILLIKNR